MSNIITVFGATGLQGGSVIRAIQTDPQLSKASAIRGVTRDSTQASALALASTGAEVVEASISANRVTSFEASYSPDTEVQQGKNVADASSNGVFVRVTHFDSKARIEKYIRDIELPATFVLAGSYMQNFFKFLGRDASGGHVLTLPTADAQFPLIDVEADYGSFVKIAMKHRESMLGKRIYAAQRYYTPSEIVSEFAQTLGRPIQFKLVSPAAFMQYSPLEMAKDLTEMLQAFSSPGYFGGADLE